MKFFKETMGVSFIQYLDDYRLEIAAELLTTTTDNILDIAFATGFNNISYFIGASKRSMGFHQESIGFDNIFIFYISYGYDMIRMLSHPIRQRRGGSTWIW